MSFYSVLDVSADAPPDACRRAFRRQALRWHPDKTDDPDAEDRFRRIERAWRVISDPAARA
eukprot:2185457-Prymnesium_polylepis.1